MSRLRIWRTSPALFMLLLIMFGLFIVQTLGRGGPITDDRGTSTTISVFTDASADAGAQPIGPGRVMLGMAILCGLAAVVLAALTIRRRRRDHDRGPGTPRGTASAPRGPPVRAFDLTTGLTTAELSILPG